MGVIFSSSLYRAAARKVPIISAPVGSGKTSLPAPGQTIPGQWYRLAVIQVQRDQQEVQLSGLPSRCPDGSRQGVPLTVYMSDVAVRRDTGLGGLRQAQVLGQPWPGRAARGARDVFRCPGREDVPAVRAAARAHVDEVVGGGEQVQVVVDDDDGGPGLQQPVEHAGQGGHVVRVQAGGRLVEDVQRAALAAAQPGGDPQPLRLAAGQGWGGLAEPQVTQADLVDGPQRRGDRGPVGEPLQAALTAQPQYVTTA